MGSRASGGLAPFAGVRCPPCLGVLVPCPRGHRLCVGGEMGSHGVGEEMSGERGVASRERSRAGWDRARRDEG
jgi:hypothetical protein